MVKIRLIRQLLIANFNLFNIEINKYQTVFLKLLPPGTILKQNYILVFPAWCCSRDCCCKNPNLDLLKSDLSFPELSTETRCRKMNWVELSFWKFFLPVGVDLWKMIFTIPIILKSSWIWDKIVFLVNHPKGKDFWPCTSYRIPTQSRLGVY